MSGEFCKTRLARMQDVLQGHVARGDVPGLVSLVSRCGETHVEVLGVQSLEGGTPMRRDTIFRIASMTKPIVAVAALMLIEECVFGLDEPVDRFLPELADPRVLKSLESEVTDTVPAQRPISVRDLLTFRLGTGFVMAFPPKYAIQKALADAGLAPGPKSPDLTNDAYMSRIGSLPLIYQPGTRWLYHTGSDLLGVLIARASGKSLGDFLRERLFEPLGMKDTGFTVPAAELGRLASAYRRDPEKDVLVLADDARDSRFSRPAPFHSGGGGLVSTADDYLAFFRMMLNKGVGGGAAWPRAHPVARRGRADDHRPAHDGTKDRRGAFLRTEPELGHGRCRDDEARRALGQSRPLRLGWRLRHDSLRRSGGGHGRHPADATLDGVARAAARVHRFLHDRLRRHQRLTEETVMDVQAYLSFQGRTQEALDFYAGAIGAKVDVVLRFKDGPPEMQSQIAPGMKEKVMHAAFHVGNTQLMATDGDCNNTPTFSGISLTLNAGSNEEADKLFAALGKGGQVQMPLSETFFAHRFGVLADKFGVKWMVLHPKNM